MTTDPISYIFGILKYVKKRICNDNINNYINNNIINQVDNNVIIKAVGSCVRAMLHNEEYIDISLIISCPKLVNEFITILEITEVLRYHECKINYKILRICYKNKEHTIYIAYNIKNLPNYNQSFNLTCNNLAMDFDGNISTIISHNEIKRYTSSTWTTSCIQDAIFGKFRVILLDTMNTLDKIISYNDICNNMVHQGFVFDRNNSKNLTQYQFMELKSHLIVSEYCKDREVSQCCCICREHYSSEPNKKTILVGCLHDFHIDCLHHWVKCKSSSSPKKTCPVCRADLKFEPGMIYGDNQADEIIQNMSVL
jgi:hypothetical protein